jgi:hypothetical protein
MRLPRRPNRPQILGITSILPALYILNYLITPLIVGEARLESYFRPHSYGRFDAKIWRNSGFVWTQKNGENPLFGERFGMIDDVMRAHVALGIAEAQLREVLGNPDAGIVDKDVLLKLGNPYNLNNTALDKEILESSDSVTYWYYYLAHQRQYPAKSILFPFMFMNFDYWHLAIKFKNGKVSNCEVVK